MSQQVDNSAVITYLKKHAVVKAWIEEVLKVKLGDDLIAALKNGIVLCYLMVEIEPLAIPTIQEATTAEFRLKENVSFFLAACQELGMAKYERFQPNELWNPSPNPVRVVECIFCLAKIAAQRDFTPAIKPIESVPDSKVVMPTGKELEDIKKMLASLGGRAGRVQKVSAELMRRKLAYLVGQNVDFSQYESGFIKFQALYRGFAARQKYKKMIRDLAYRERVAKEILSTERDYVQNLDICIKIYVVPLGELANSKKPILTKDQIKGIFADIQTIFTFNESLLKRLEERVGDWSQHQKLGDIFVDIVAFLKVYTNYVQNFNTSLGILSSVGKKAAVSKFLRECTEDPRCKSLDLSAFLIMPVQRIPRYHLLLQELVKHTWVEHCDYENLNEAMEKVKQIGAFINDKKREAEGLAETFARHSWIKGKELDVTPDRRFVREDTFVDVKKNSDVTIFLFNDLIVYGKPISTIGPGKTKIKFKGQLTTIDCEVSEKPPVKNHKFCFALSDNVYSAKSDADRLEFVEAVKEVKDLATVRLSSHLKARMNNVPKKGNTLKRIHARGVEVSADTADAASAEDVLRMRKKNATRSVAQPIQPPQRNAESRLSDNSNGRESISSNGSLSSDVSDGEAEKEALNKSKNEILQRLLDLPPSAEGKKDSKKTKKQREKWEQELEGILRKLSELDQHTNTPPVVAEKDLASSPISSPVGSPLASPGVSPSTSPTIPTSSVSLSGRSSPVTARRSPAQGVMRTELRRSSNAVAVPLATSTRDLRAFNSVRGYQPNPTQQPSPPGGLTRVTSTPALTPSPSVSPTPSPSPSPPKPAAPAKPKIDITNFPSSAASLRSPTEPTLRPTHSAPIHATSPTHTPVQSPTHASRPSSPPPTQSSTNRPSSPPPIQSSTHANRPSSPPPPQSSNHASRPSSPPPAQSPTHTPVHSTSRPSSPSPPQSPTTHGSRPSSPQPTLALRSVSANNVVPKARGEFTLEEVQQKKLSLEMPYLETYLSDNEFLRVFKISREAFYKQPKWKQELQKKENRLI